MNPRHARKRPIGSLYHTTSYASMSEIAEDGLTPRRGRGLFDHGGYAEHSQGKVFLAEGRDAALTWFGKIEDMLHHHFADNEDPDAVVPVLLEVTRPKKMSVHIDPLGDADVFGSWYVTGTIPPNLISYFDPKENDWVGIEDWEAAPGPEAGLKEVEHHSEDGDVVGEDDAWTSRGFFVFGPYENGGFKPNMDDDEAWGEDLRPNPRADEEHVAREAGLVVREKTLLWDEDLDGKPMRAVAIEAPDETGIKAIQLTDKDYPETHYAVIHRNTQPGQAAWQVSRFDDRGAVGHTNRGSLTEAIKAAREDGYELAVVEMVRLKKNPRSKALTGLSVTRVARVNPTYTPRKYAIGMPRALLVQRFNELVERTPPGSFPRPVSLVIDEATALAGRPASGRGQAASTADTVHIAPKLLDASRERQMGVLLHELAHVSLMQRGIEEHTEREADAEAEALFGYKIRYDKEDVQTIGQGTSPRPAHLDSRGSDRKSTRENPRARFVCPSCGHGGDSPRETEHKPGCRLGPRKRTRSNPDEFFVVNTRTKKAVTGSLGKGPRWKWEGIPAAAIVLGHAAAVETLGRLPKAERRDWEIVTREEVMRNNPRLKLSAAVLSALDLYVLDPAHIEPDAYDDDGGVEAARAIAEAIHDGFLDAPSDATTIWAWHTRLSHAADSAAEDKKYGAAKVLNTLASSIVDPLR